METLEQLLEGMEENLKAEIIEHVKANFVPKVTAAIDPPPQGPGGSPDGN